MTDLNASFWRWKVAIFIHWTQWNWIVEFIPMKLIQFNLNVLNLNIFTSDDLFSMIKKFNRNTKWRTFYFGVQAMAILLQSRAKFSCSILVLRNGSHIERILRNPGVQAYDNWLINKYENLSTWWKCTHTVSHFMCCVHVDARVTSKFAFCRSQNKHLTRREYSVWAI